MQLAFAFGMLAMIAIIVIVVIIVGLLKVKKQQEEITYLEDRITSTILEYYERFRDIDRRIDDAYTNARDMSNAYTDGRIDKLEQKLTSKK